MTEKNDFPVTFEKLKAILKPYESKLVVVHDTDRNYYLDTNYVMKNKHRLFFAAVRIGKAYVSFHLMPVYASSDLLQAMSPELRRRMQGKSCFNFKTVDEKLLEELEKITKAGFKKFHNPEFLQKLTQR
ncbi:MAG TPA: hypothetical protein VGJ66_19285 [Pyrinomonadaceae bacterium]|jgi:hypothetical protein